MAPAIRESHQAEFPHGLHDFCTARRGIAFEIS
jgi:hypothetical protein